MDKSTPENRIFNCAAVYIGQTSRALKTRIKNILKPPRTCLTKTLNWPNVPKKLATALSLKTCQFVTSIPNGTSGFFWKHSILTRKGTQSTSTLSFHVCTSISIIFRTFLAHALCIFVTYLPILPSLVIFAYLTDEGHQSDRNVLLFKNFLNQCQRCNFVLYHACLQPRYF